MNNMSRPTSFSKMIRIAAKISGIGTFSGNFRGSGIVDPCGLDSISRFLRRHCMVEVTEEFSLGGGIDPLPTIFLAVGTQGSSQLTVFIWNFVHTGYYKPQEQMERIC